MWEILCRQKFTKQTHQEYLHYEYSKFRLGFGFIKVIRFDTSWYVLMRFDVFWCIQTCFDLFCLMSFWALKKCWTIWIQAKSSLNKHIKNNCSMNEYLKWKYIVNLYGIMFCSTDSSRKEILCWQKFWIRECSCIMPYLRL